MADKTVLAEFLVNYGPHPWEDAGWQIAFDFGDVQVSIAHVPGAYGTHGVELMAWGLFEKPIENVMPWQAFLILNCLLIRYQNGGK